MYEQGESLTKIEKTKNGFKVIHTNVDIYDWQDYVNLLENHDIGLENAKEKVKKFKEVRAHLLALKDHIKECKNAGKPFKKV